MSKKPNRKSERPREFSRSDRSATDYNTRDANWRVPNESLSEWYARMDRIRQKAAERYARKRRNKRVRQEEEEEEVAVQDHSHHQAYEIEDSEPDTPDTPVQDEGRDEELPQDVPDMPDQGYDSDNPAAVENAMDRYNQASDRGNELGEDALVMPDARPSQPGDEGPSSPAADGSDAEDHNGGRDFLLRILESTSFYDNETKTIDLEKFKSLKESFGRLMVSQYDVVSRKFACNKLGNLIHDEGGDVLFKYIWWKLTDPLNRLQRFYNPVYNSIENDIQGDEVLQGRFLQTSWRKVVNYLGQRENAIVVQNTPLLFSFVFTLLMEELMIADPNNEYNPSVTIWEDDFTNMDVPAGVPEHLTNVITRISRDRKVSLEELMNVMTQLWLKVRGVISNGLYELSYEESGYTIFVGDSHITVMIVLRKSLTFVPSQRYRAEMEAVINEHFPNKGIIVPGNETDNYCLFYCVCMGYVKLMHNNIYSNRSSVVIDVDTINRQVKTLLGVNEKATEIIRKYIEPITDKTKLSQFLDSEEAKNSMSYQQANDFYHDAERELVPAANIALDVYSCDMKHKHPKIFPIYYSKKNTEQRIQLLNMEFGSRSHFALVTNKRSIFEQTGGAIFEVCSKCHQSFFTREAFLKHLTATRCKDTDERQVSSWSTSADNLVDPGEIAGFCPKCHLIFEHEFPYQHHMKNCFMRNRRGTKYIRLVDEQFEVPVMKGEEIPYEYLPDKHILFADFECCINPDGKHEFMSFGLYDSKRLTFDLGYDMLTFMTKLEEIVSARGEKEIYVYFHNGMNYDVNFIIKHLLQNPEQYKKWSIKIMMKSSSSIQSVKLRFYKGDIKNLRTIVIGDTFKFMTMSLDAIVESSKGETMEDNMRIFPRFFSVFRLMKVHRHPVLNSSINLILQKNLFPYKFFDTPDKLSVPMSEFSKIFEPKEENLVYFANGTSVETLAKNKPLFDNICSLFGLNDSACQYHDLYLKCDVMQLADVFLNIREEVFESHKVDLCDYIGTPSATWHAWLRANPNLELGLYTDTFHAEFFASMMRGGITSAPLRYAESDDTHSILYFDVNGLYPYVMQKYPFPMGDFRTVVARVAREDNCEEFLLDYFEQLKREGKGAGLCVDLSIPKELHNKFDQYPPAPEHRVLKDCFMDPDGELYEFMKRWSEANDGEPLATFKGLVGTLYDKKEYAVNWKLLKWYIKHGVKVTKIHYSIEYTLGRYLEEYVTKNIEIRNRCPYSKPFLKKFWKLFGNALYGKTCESPFNKKKFLLFRNRDKLRGAIAKGNVSRIIPIDENNSLIELDGEIVELKYPTYIGSSVTEYSKLVMYKLFYDKLMKVFPDMKLVYTDTDSFIINFPHEKGVTVRQIFDKIDSVAPGVIGDLGGQIKSETGEDRIMKCVALRSKLYTYVTESGEVCKKAKGVPKANITNELTFEKYTETLLNLVDVYSQDIELFKRTAFGIKSERLIKKVISSNDGKRKIEPDGIHTHAWGYDP